MLYSSVLPKVLPLVPGYFASLQADDDTQAIPINSLPYTLKVNNQDQPRFIGNSFVQAREFWFKFTSPIDGEISLLGVTDLNIFGGALTLLSVFKDDASTQYLTSFNSGAGEPVQIPVTNGQILYFVYSYSLGPVLAEFNLSIEAFTPIVSATGPILITDDTQGFPAIVVSSTADYTLIKFIPNIVNGESGDILPDRSFILLDDNTDISPLPNHGFTLYTGQLALVKDNIFDWLAFDFTDPPISTNLNNKFYVGTNKSSGGGLAQIRTIDTTGTIGPTIWTLVNSQIRGLGINKAETRAYISGNHSGSATDSTIQVYDLVNNVFLTDLAATLVGYNVPVDIFVLADDTILVLYSKGTVTRDILVKQYNSSGAVLNTYDFGTGQTFSVPRLARALDDPNSFWIYIQNITGIADLKNIKISDGSTITTRHERIFEKGIFQGTATFTPERFGVSQSCPFMILTNITSINPGSGLYTIIPTNEIQTKLNDTIYQPGSTTIEVAIPTPYAITYLIGD